MAIRRRVRPAACFIEPDKNARSVPKLTPWHPLSTDSDLTQVRRRERRDCHLRTHAEQQRTLQSTKSSARNRKS